LYKYVIEIFKKKKKKIKFIVPMLCVSNPMANR
jgi:hypothetical protein